ncbi:MAG TPA: PorV/PorQ family protein [Candidatus Krumholzibacteria bacterium]|nr:PorV/PorQ family protein [Candidatus Krumholzibacteria bacterium]
MMRWQHALTAIVIMLLPGAAMAGDPGSAGALFLRVGVGARAAAMGDAYTGVAEDASSVYWNPGAMAAVLGTKVTLSHVEYFQSLRFEQAAVTHETKWGTMGFMFTGLFMDDLERRDDAASAVALGEFGAYDVAFAAAFARYIVPNVSIGLSIKPVYQRIDELSAAGLAFDVGIYHTSRIQGVKLAAVAGNLGAPMKFDTEEYALPRYVKVGGSYEREVVALEGRVLVTVDLMFPNDDDGRQHIGAEYSYRRTVAVRAGYKAGYDSQGATFGLGVNYRDVAIDYAFLPVENDLGDSHRFGVGFSF